MACLVAEWKFIMTTHWGLVCDKDWDFKDAITVCRQLGFIEAHEAKNGSFFGESQLPVVMNRVACKGTEGYLADCSFVCPTSQSCHSSAGVVCKPSKTSVYLPF